MKTSSNIILNEMYMMEIIGKNLKLSDFSKYKRNFKIFIDSAEFAEKPPVFVQGYIDGSVHLSCKSALKGLTVNWFYNGEKISSNENFIQLPSGALEINNLTRGLAGEYTCGLYLDNHRLNSVKTKLVISPGIIEYDRPSFQPTVQPEISVTEGEVRNKFQIRPFWILTDTGEDSKLVHRQKFPKVDRLFSTPFFPTRPSDEYDSAPSRKYTRPLLDVFACIGQVFLFFVSEQDFRI